MCMKHKTYEEILHSYKFVCMDDIIEVSSRFVPSLYQSCPWAYPGLQHGTAVLETEEQLCSYIAAYGQMHKEKCQVAYKNFPFSNLKDGFEIYDWGCGQGLATVCLIDFLKTNNLLHLVKRITLEELSIAALQRAELHVKCVTEGTIPVEIINKGLPVVTHSSNSITKIDAKHSTAIHLFSNIIDIELIDLKQLASLVTSSGKYHYAMCIGPANRNEHRIDAFCRYFSNPKSISDYTTTELGKTGNGHVYGCFIKTFSYELSQSEPVLIPYSFFPPKQFFAAYQLDCIRETDKDTKSEDYEFAAFEVLAPFDIGASTYDDINPILAVLNNIITRGLPTKASPFVEDSIKNIYNCSEINNLYGGLQYSPVDDYNWDDTRKVEKIMKEPLGVEVKSDWYRSTENEGAAIVFCPHRNGSLGVHSSLTSRGVASSLESTLETHVSRFVGGDDPQEQDDFINGKTNMMVATKAFGMGIDKTNVRFALNMNHPGSLEDYVQEAGRAGRDRKMALSIILYSDLKFGEQNPITRIIETVPVDFGVHKFFFDGNFIGPDFEKMIMYYLMNFQENLAENIGSHNNFNSENNVSGFLSHFESAKEGDIIISFISYQYPSKDSRALSDKLRNLNLPTIESLIQDKDPQKQEEKRKEKYFQILSKAVYRMCCVGIIDDFTQDYVQQTFRIVTKKKADGEYFNHLKQFLMRYFAEERAEAEVERAKGFKGNNEMQQCLGYITEFVYEKIATKRKRAIWDIEQFCNEAVYSNDDWLETNEELKDYIYFYFNSKYAREGYKADNGEDFSLTDESERGKKSSWEILFKYLRVVDDEIVSAGSQKDNVKHLLGAVRLIRRALTDKNPTIDLLNVFCLSFLKVGRNRNLQHELRKSFIDGYKEFYRRNPDKKQFYEQIRIYLNTLKQKNAIIKNDLKKIEEWVLTAEIELQTEWLEGFKSQYLS